MKACQPYNNLHTTFDEKEKLCLNLSFTWLQGNSQSRTLGKSAWLVMYNYVCVWEYRCLVAISISRGCIPRARLQQKKASETD